MVGGNNPGLRSSKGPSSTKFRHWSSLYRSLFDWWEVPGIYSPKGISCTEVSDWSMFFRSGLIGGNCLAYELEGISGMKFLEWKK